ncbi:hypothetical protein [Methylobacterium sp. 10]|uniref:hypothetical protein n=1 Tax=Methylobacterium sp. 10 TaxID=1101191 RepID=UPI0012DD8BCE|nr:hypothetical protein [Methylobacterium sp. 10]
MCQNAIWSQTTAARVAPRTAHRLEAGWRHGDADAVGQPDHGIARSHLGLDQISLDAQHGEGPHRLALHDAEDVRTAALGLEVRDDVGETAANVRAAIDTAEEPLAVRYGRALAGWFGLPDRGGFVGLGEVRPPTA